MEWISNSKFGVPAENGTVFTNKKNERLRIHKIHGYGDGWYLSCETLGFYQRNLNTEDFDEAVEKTKNIVFERIIELQNLYLPIVNDDSENKIVRY